MAGNVFPTKGNLMALKKQLSLANLGYELLEKKRTVMMGEMMKIIHDVSGLQKQVNDAFDRAYASLMLSNLSLGQNSVAQICMSAPRSDKFDMRYRSVMGIEIPEIFADDQNDTRPDYGVFSTNFVFDKTYVLFCRARDLVAKQSALENCAYRLAFAIKQTQKRSNALQNVIIPRLAQQIKYISSYLEEKERDEFVTMKMLKRKKQRA